MKKNHIIMFYLLLVFIFFFAYIYDLGAYRLLEVDETRYVNIAKTMFNTKDFFTLYLNGEFFFEKPPLFFLIECLSFKLTGIISELTARLPIVLLSLLPTGFLLGLCKKVRGDKFAIITVATLLITLQYMLITKIAILDSVLTSFVSSSLLCYFFTHFVENKNKKYYWILTYVFSALAVLSKGIPGVAIPFIVIFISSIIFKTWKETLKYSSGILLFLLITLPWHLVMLKMHGNLFFDEYIIKHHLLRFLGSDVINRTQPWYFYMLTLLWGLFPHIFLLLSKVVDIKNIKFDINNNYSKLLLLSLIATLSILIFFSLSGAKLITYILPIYPFTSILIGDLWLKYINNNDKSVRKSLIILNLIFWTATILLCFVKFVMPNDIYKEFLPVQFTALLLLIPFLIYNSIFLIKQKRLQTFFLLVIFISVLSGILTPYVYNFNYSFGQNDLMRFAQFAKDNNYTISTYMTGQKYGLLYYGDKSYVEFQTDEDSDWLNNELAKPNVMIIARNKYIENLPLKIKEKGVKYSIIEANNK